MCVLIFSTTFVWNISHSEKNWARYDHKCISVCMWSDGYCGQILVGLESSRQFFEKKNPEILNFIKIRPVWAQLLHVDGRTDMTKLTAAFKNAPPRVLIWTLSAKTRKPKTRSPDLERGGHPIIVIHIRQVKYMNEGRLEPETLHLVPRNMERLLCADGTETRVMWRHSDDTLSAWPADTHFFFLQLASFSVEGY